MGTFDSLHAGARCGQVKCLGRRLYDLRFGDEAILHAVSVLEPRSRPPGPSDVDHYSFWAELVGEPVEMPDQVFERETFAGVPVPVRDWQIAMDEGYAVFRDNRFGAWPDEPEPGLIVVDNLGWLVMPGHVRRPGAASPPLDCGICNPRPWLSDNSGDDLSGGDAPWGPS